MNNTAKFARCRILRPSAGFTSVYQEQATTQPIYLFPDGVPFDQQALDKASGFDQKLARGLSVPLGAHVLLWLPNLSWIDDDEVEQPYDWFCIWRLRQVFDNQRLGKPYHLTRKVGGADDDGGVVRYPIPAAYDQIVYIGSEPVLPQTHTVSNAHAQDFAGTFAQYPGPLVAKVDDSGVEELTVQQGILDVGTFSQEAKRPFYWLKEFMARGDEMMIGLYRSIDAGTWDFAADGTDELVSQFFDPDAPAVGAYATWGKHTAGRTTL